MKYLEHPPIQCNTLREAYFYPPEGKIMLVPFTYTTLVDLVSIIEHFIEHEVTENPLQEVMRLYVKTSLMLHAMEILRIDSEIIKIGHTYLEEMKAALNTGNELFYLNFKKLFSGATFEWRNSSKTNLCSRILLMRHNDISNADDIDYPVTERIISLY